MRLNLEPEKISNLFMGAFKLRRQEKTFAIEKTRLKPIAEHRQLKSQSLERCGRRDKQFGENISLKWFTKSA